MKDLQLLNNSCTRLPKLIELDAPASILVAELQILSNHTLDAIAEAVQRNLHREMDTRRALQSLKEHLNEKETPAARPAE